MGEKESWPVDRSPAVTVAEASTLGTGQESPPEAAGEQEGSLQSESEVLVRLLTNLGQCQGRSMTFAKG